jgi:hypothetical protein
VPRRRPVTNPPRALPLLPIAFVGIVVATQVIELYAHLAHLLAWDTDDFDYIGLGPGPLALDIGIDVATFVLASLLLRWLVRRWVVRQPPDAPRI